MRGNQIFIERNHIMKFLPANHKTFIILKSLSKPMITNCKWYTYSVGNSLSQVGFGSFLHFGQHHGWDLLWEEVLLLILVDDLNLGFSLNADHLEWPVLHISLDSSVIELAADQTLSVCKWTNLHHEFHKILKNVLECKKKNYESCWKFFVVKVAHEVIFYGI